MRSYLVFQQLPPQPNGRKVSFRYYDEGMGKICNIEMNDHDANFQQIGLVKAGSPERALHVAKERWSDTPFVARRLAVQPVGGMQ